LKFPEKYRHSSPLHEKLQCFIVPFRGRALRVIASNDKDWERTEDKT